MFLVVPFFGAAQPRIQGGSGEFVSKVLSTLSSAISRDNDRYRIVT